MTDRQVLVTAPFDPSAVESLEGLSFTYPAERQQSVSLAKRTDLGDLSSYDAVVTEADLVDEAALSAMPNLKLAITCRSGPVNIDLDACKAHGVIVTNTPARNADATADVAFGLLLSTVRQLSRAEQWMRSGGPWRKEDRLEPYRTFRGPMLNGRTLGIIGAGAVGRRMVQRALGFGMTVIVHDPYVDASTLPDGVTLVELDELMSNADIVSVHVPLSDATTGMVKAEHLAKMKPSAFFINAGRAATVDEQAIFELLRDHKIAGGGFDVHYEEPLPADSPWRELDNVTMTPHIAGASDDVILSHSMIAAASLKAWAAGEEIPNRIA